MAENNRSRKRTNASKQKQRQGLIAILAVAAGYFFLTRSQSGGGGGWGIGTGDSGTGGTEEAPMESPMPTQDAQEPQQQPVEETAPQGPEGEAQTQTISTGSMTAQGEETTLEERGERREQFARDTTDTSSRQQTAPQSSSGEAQTQTISTGSMQAGDESTTLEERGERRAEFAGATDDTTDQTTAQDDSQPRETDSYTVLGGGL